MMAQQAKVTPIKQRKANYLEANREAFSVALAGTKSVIQFADGVLASVAADPLISDEVRGVIIQVIQ